MFCFNKDLNRNLAILNIGEKIADTANRYHKIGLDFWSSQLSIGFDFNNDSCFKCIIISDMDLVSNSVVNNLQTSAAFMFEFECSYNHYIVSLAL